MQKRSAGCDLSTCVCNRVHTLGTNVGINNNNTSQCASPPSRLRRQQGSVGGLTGLQSVCSRAHTCSLPPLVYPTSSQYSNALPQQPDKPARRADSLPQWQQKHVGEPASDTASNAQQHAF